MPKHDEATAVETTVETVVETPAAVAPPAAVDAAAEEPGADAERKRWKKALVIVGNHRLPNDGRPVIVVEERTFSGERNTADFKAELKTDGYPSKADIYYRTDPTVEFPKDGRVVTLGQDIAQIAFWGFSNDPRGINVGPASPAYGAANLAYLQGAEEIEIVGLSDFEKEQLQPYIAKLAEGGPAPYSDQVPDIRAPAPNVKVILA